MFDCSEDYYKLRETFFECFHIIKQIDEVEIDGKKYSIKKTNPRNTKI